MPARRPNRAALCFIGTGVCALAALIVAKVWVIGSYAGPTPYWDQWDAEAATLYKPWLEGTLIPGQFFAAHNEHRILTTRVLHLAFFELTGRQWNTLVQMHLNALLHIAAVAVFVLFARRLVASGLQFLLWLFAAAFFVLPFGWENTLAGFQTQFYLLLLLSFVLLWLCNGDAFATRDTLLCCFLAVALVFTMASGSLVVLGAVVMLLVRKFMLGNGSIPPPLVAVLAVIGAVGIATTPVVAGHAALKAQSIGQFCTAVGAAAIWPLPANGSLPVSLLLAVCLQAPLLVGLLVALRRREQNAVPFLCLLSLALWFGLQVAALGYGRGAAGLSSRYLDILSFGVLINFACLLFLGGNIAASQRLAYVFLTTLWLGGVASGLAYATPRLVDDLQGKAGISRLQEHHVRQYLHTGDAQWLRNAKHHEIPYPSADRLQALLDDPTIRNFLPKSLFLLPQDGFEAGVRPVEPAVLASEVQPGEIDMAKTQRIYSSAISKHTEAGGKIEWVAEGGVLLHPGDEVPSEIVLDAEQMAGREELAFWIRPLPPDAATIPEAGTVKVRVFADGKLAAEAVVTPSAPRTIFVEPSGAAEIRIQSENANGPSYDWLVFGLR